MSGPLISLIAAVSKNGVIGRDNDMPWHLSNDLKRFKAMTIGKPLVIGRKNFESFGGRPLPGRPHVVITRDTSYTFDHENVHIVHSFEEGMEMARRLAKESGVDEVVIAGGGEIYKLGMDVADVLNITHINAVVEGDVFFPPIDPDKWVGEEGDTVEADEKNDFSYRYVTYRPAV